MCGPRVVRCANVTFAFLCLAFTSRWPVFGFERFGMLIFDLAHTDPVTEHDVALKLCVRPETTK